jgi:hypothetical protein
MEPFDNNAEFIAQQYAKALNTLDVEPIAFLLDKNFKFIFPVASDRRSGITTDIRYIGQLYKSFAELKKEGIAVKAEVRHFMYEDRVVPCVVLLPPQEVKIIYPITYYSDLNHHSFYHKSHKNVFENEVLLTLHIGNKLLWKVEALHLLKNDKKTISSTIGEIKFV